MILPGYAPKHILLLVICTLFLDSMMSIGTLDIMLRHWCGKHQGQMKEWCCGHLMMTYLWCRALVCELHTSEVVVCMCMQCGSITPPYPHAGTW